MFMVFRLPITRCSVSRMCKQWPQRCGPVLMNGINTRRGPSHECIPRFHETKSNTRGLQKLLDVPIRVVTWKHHTCPIPLQLERYRAGISASVVQLTPERSSGQHEQSLRDTPWRPYIFMKKGATHMPRD